MAALASPRQTPAPVQQLTPPSSSHGGASWDFAVPLNNSRTSYEQEPYMSEYVTSAHSPRQPLTSQANGFAKPVRSTTWETEGQYHENNQPYLVPDRVNELHKKPSGDMSASNSEQDGVLEYYKSHANSRKGPSGPTKAKGKKKPTKAGTADPNWVAIEHDENNWIHRDKLKEIETRELEEAGFRVGRASRSNSRSQSATRRSRDRTNSETAEGTLSGEDRYESRKVVSPIPAEDEDEPEQFHTWSPTTYEQFAPSTLPNSSRTNDYTVRPGTSRIPLPKGSGIPVPASMADRDAPLPRSRAGSANWNGDAIATNGARIRSGSVGSQALLDEPEDRRQTTPPFGHARNISSASASLPKSPQVSPMKTKTPGKPTPASGTRKIGTQKALPKKHTSVVSPSIRPGTSGGSVSRPTTSHRPEGEAPWLATMYKPDPRLPPDQQIIPTHAKRMQQQQWETQGLAGSMYDKDFRLLKTDDSKDKRLSQTLPIDLEKAQENETWPLPSAAKQPSLEQMDTNANKSPNPDQGGYKLTPTIPHSPHVASPKLAPPIAPASKQQPKTTRLPEPVEEVKEKKGCCCIVM